MRALLALLLWSTAMIDSRVDLDPGTFVQLFSEGKERAELITHASKYIRGYDPLTGKELWRLGSQARSELFARHLS